MSSRVPCHDPEPAEIASRLVKRSDLGYQIQEIKTFTDDEYQKVYSAYLIVTESDQRYVLKLAEENPELYIYQTILRHDDPTPRLLAYEHAGGGQCWLLLPYCGDNDIRDTGMPNHIAAARALATFHANHWSTTSSEHPTLSSWQNGSRV